MHDTQTANDAAKDGVVMGARPADVLQEHGQIDLVCRDADGNVKWRETIENALTNEGQQYMLNAAFGGVAGVATQYIRLLNTGAAPGLGSTLASPGGTEAAGTGYSAQAVTFTISKPATNYQAASSTASWTAGAPWTAVTHLYVATTSNNTGKMVAWAALSQSRTLAANDQLNATWTVTQQ